MLLGRDQERRALDGLLAAARNGQSGVLALVGEPGIGKSALLEDAVARADGMRVVRARGVESEAQVPFAGLLELLRPMLGALDRIPKPQAAALEAALALRPSGAQDRFAVGAATLSLITAIAEDAPVLVAVDDLQWFDASSGDALLFAIRRLVADPVAVLLATRADEPSLLDGAGLPELRLEGISRDAAGALLTGVAPDAADRIYTATGGNPLALLELEDGADLVAPEIPVPVPTSIASAFGRRLASLSPPTRTALLLASASGTGDVAVLARAGLDVAQLDQAAEAGLVTLRGGVLEFRHPLVRSVVYAAATPEERRCAHRALAQALPDRDADRRAWHLAEATLGPDDGVAAALEQAGRRASERTAFAAAGAAFERAARLTLDDARRGTLLRRAAEQSWLGGSVERARTLLGEAGLLVDDQGVDALRGRVAIARGEVSTGIELLRSAAERARPHDAVLMLAEAAEACLSAGAAREMLSVAERATELAQVSADGQAPFFAAAARGAARFLNGLDGGADLRRAIELFEGSASDDAPATLTWAATASMFLREADTGRELVDRAIDAARDQSAIGVLPRLLVRLARDESVTERWPEAQAHFHDGIRLAREVGANTDLAAGLAGLAWLDARRGRERDCRLNVAEARALCISLGLGFYELWTYAALADLELALGNTGAAIEQLEARHSRVDEIGIDDVDLSPEPELVDAYLRVGRTDDAVRAAAAHDERARRKGQPWALARAARTWGLLADEFEPHFEEALELHAQTPDTFERARTLLAYGARLRRVRKKVRARERLREAIEAFDRLGPTPWAELAGAELAATGETARRRDPSTLGDLTPQELQIALLLAQGRTTREAAAALFLSPKTIEYHLRSIYRKLGVNSRDALALVFEKQLSNLMTEPAG